MSQDLINKSVVVVMALGVTAVFLAMIYPFLMALLFAGLFTALARPLFLRLERLLGGRRGLASFLTLLATAVIVIIPLGVLTGLLVAQALDVSATLTGYIRSTVDQPGEFARFLERLPFYETLHPYRAQILQQAGETVGTVSKLIVKGLSSITLGTANVIFLAFVLLYSMYFLLLDGEKLIDRILYYLPLKTHDERILLQKLSSVTRATLRGSLLIGLLQGTLAGIAFAVAGIPNAVFWGAIMTVLSVIPSVGSALVWIPAVIVLIVQGEVATGIALGLFCGLVVGSLDNVLRPILVGKDTRMHELMIFLSTLGGIFMFGFPGVVVGPLIASLFISIWELYGFELRGVLPEVRMAALPGGGPSSNGEPPSDGLPSTAEQPDETADRTPEGGSPRRQEDSQP